MTKRLLLTDLEIIQGLKIHYDIDIIKLSSLQVGADINAFVFKADAKDQSYFVKLKDGHHDEINLVIVALLIDAGIAPIIAPLQTNQQKSMLSLEGFHWIVYPYIQAQDGFAHPLSEKQWILLGKTLRQIHDLEVPNEIQARLRKENYSPKFRNIVRSIYDQFLTLDIKDDIAEKLFAYMKQEQKKILQLVHTAEELAQKIPSLNAKQVLCHSDIHGGNVLIDANESIYMVDWDEPMMAPKERDLMFIGGGVGNVWNQPVEATYFYQGYGQTSVDKTILAYYRHERIVEDIAIYAQALLLSPEGGDNRKIMYQHFMDMFATNGVVEIAFDSLRR